MITVSARCAFFTLGSRKAFTPLLTASTPVIAVHPLAKTFSKSHSVTASVMGGGGGSAVTNRKSTRLNSSHGYISYAVFCLKKKQTLRNQDLSAPIHLPLT